MSNPDPSCVEFAPWSTEVQDASLSLVEIAFSPRQGPCPLDPHDGSSRSPGGTRYGGATLRALFEDHRRARVVRFAFHAVVAFRALDENGLLELWDASALSPRPAHTTFRVRGHGWTRESVLVFAMGRGGDRYSHVVATDDLCLEVICDEEPVVIVHGAGGDD